ncbi:MAG: hypothetical protein ABI233_11660 [Chthoniobacterales bacterium]
MTTKMPVNPAQAINLGVDMSSGLGLYATELDITKPTATQLDDGVVALTQTDGLYHLARTTKQTVSDAYQLTLPPLNDFLSAARGLFTTFFTPRWNAQWAQAGFITPSTAVPRRASSQLALTLRIATFLAAHPTYENSKSKVTAVQGHAVRMAAVTGRNNLATALIDLRGKATANETAFQALYDLEFSLLKTLEGTLAGDDPRWLAFGLKMPATKTTPGQPQNVRAMLGERGEVLVQCDPTPLAKRFRCRILIVGVQMTYQLAWSGKEPMGAIKSVQPGVTLQIIMQAVNGGNQGVASDPILFTVPLPGMTLAKALPAPPVAEHKPLMPSGNGNGNGIGHGAAARVS